MRLFFRLQNQMGPRQGSSRFDKRDSGGKNEGNSQMSQSGWGMYGGQSGWNQAAAANYQNWAQYQQGKFCYSFGVRFFHTKTR